MLKKFTKDDREDIESSISDMDDVGSVPSYKGLERRLL